MCLSTLDQVEMQKFWQALCMDVLSDDEGHVDIFYPLGGTGKNHNGDIAQQSTMWSQIINALC